MILPFTANNAPSDAFNGFSINWAHVEMEHVDHWEEFNEILDALEENGITRYEPTQDEPKLVCVFWKLANHYVIEFQKNYITLRWVEYRIADDWTVPRQVTLGSTELVSHEVTGYRSFYKFINQFQKLYKAKFADVYGGGDFQLWNRIRKCIPRPVNWADKSDKIAQHCYKADISSSYGFEGSKPLPTLRGCKRVQGRVKPSPDYPFVFYLNSRHIAIYGEFDTHEFDQYVNWYDVYWTQWTRAEVSLCCKAVPLSLGPIFRHYYDGRMEHVEYKQYMNLFVGYCYRDTYPEFSHVAAIILARAAWRILNLAQEIMAADNVIRLIATDSVLWEGDLADNTVSVKTFGAFLLEYSDVRALIMGSKKYQIEEPDGHCLTRWAGVKKELTENLKFGDMKACGYAPKAYRWNGWRLEAAEVENDD